MKEIWKDVEGYEGYYQISNYGNVKSLERKVIRKDGVVQIRSERIMSKRLNNDGYIVAKFNVNKKSKSVAVHILVAKHFIPNPNNYSEVNHKDCNRKNNKVDNLEWCTHQQNIEYSKKLGHYKGRYGKDNPNYGNHILGEKYKNDPELAKKNLSRPREQNGRCVPIKMITKTKTYIFKFIGEAAEFLIANGYTKSSVDTIRTHITISIKENKPYLNCKFQRVSTNK